MNRKKKSTENNNNNNNKTDPMVDLSIERKAKSNLEADFTLYRR